MSELQSSFEKLTGQTLTDADVQRLYRIKNALRLGDNDALWLLLMALDYPVTFYEKLPAQMKQASMEVLNEFRATADAIAKASAEAAKADLAKAVATTAQQVASDVVGVKRSRWVATAAIAIGLGVAMVAGGWLYAYVKGRSDMEITLRAQQPALTWLGSSAGQRARELSDQGIIEWVDSLDGFMARQYSREGLIAWLVSDAGKRARELSAEGVVEWIDSPRGRLAREFSANGSIQWLASEQGQLARALSHDGIIEWLDSPAGRRAHELSTDGTIAWFDSDVGQRARELSADGTIDMLETRVGRRLMAAARSGAGRHFVDMMDCRSPDEGPSWFVSKDRGWCGTDGRTWWPYLPAR